MSVLFVTAYQNREMTLKNPSLFELSFNTGILLFQTVVSKIEV